MRLSSPPSANPGCNLILGIFFLLFCGGAEFVFWFLLFFGGFLGLFFGVFFKENLFLELESQIHGFSYTNVKL